MTSPSMTIDIADLDKAAVLAALYNGSRPQGLGFLHYQEEGMTVETAQEILDHGQTYFDYLQGRVMKVDLSDDSFNPYGYDRDNGEGAAFSVIRELREENITDGGQIKRLHEYGRTKAAPKAHDALGSGDLADTLVGPYISE